MNSTASSNNSYWQSLFAPKSVAIIGASRIPGTWGYNIMWRLLASGERRVYLVNPSASEIMGRPAYARIADIPDPVDLAVIVVPAAQAPAVLEECTQKGIKAAVVISAGFAEADEAGRKLEDELVGVARRGGVRFVGPNSMGHADTSSHLSTSAWTPEIPPGQVALVSQSGNLGNRILIAGMNLGIGFSKFVSTGNEADLRLEDYLEYLGQDDNTRIIVAYIEGLREGRRFFQLAREITLKKPVVVIKSGGTAGSARAARSHTGALAGSVAVYAAAFRQAGVIRVEDDDELLDLVIALLGRTLPRGNRVGILAIGGGLGVVAAEACEREGLTVAPLASATIDKLSGLLPPRWPHANPVDMVGINATVDNAIVLGSLLALMEDENIDSILLLAPLAFGAGFLSRVFHFNDEEMKAFEKKQEDNLTTLKQRVAEHAKPVVVVMPVNDLETYSYIIRQGVPVYTSPRRAARVLRHLAWYKSYLDSNQR